MAKKDEFHCVKCGRYCGDGAFYEEDGTYCFECWVEKREKERAEQQAKKIVKKNE